jgi:hypothetical protein
MRKNWIVFNDLTILSDSFKRLETSEFTWSIRGNTTHSSAPSFIERKETSLKIDCFDRWEYSCVFTMGGGCLRS